MRADTKQSFPLKIATAYSLYEKKLILMIKEVLHKRKWKLEGMHNTADQCFAVLNKGDASLLILDDTVEVPASFMLREQQFRTVPLLTPTIVICSDHNSSEIPCMESMGHPEIIEKPLTPEKFLKAFDNLIKRWSQPKLSLVRKASRLIVANKEIQGVKILTDLLKSQKAPARVSSALALFYRSNNNFLLTEKLLFDAYRKGHLSMTILLPLIDLYLYSGCPSKALKLIKKANIDFGNPNFLCIDAIQCHLLLNQIAACIPYFQQMIENDYLSHIARQYLPRIAYSSGQLELFDQCINYRGDRFDDYQRSWHLLSDKDAQKRLDQYQRLAPAKKMRQKEEREREGREAPAANRKLTIDQSRYLEVGSPLFSGKAAG